MNAAQLVEACRVPASVEPRRVGLWEIARTSLANWPVDDFSAGSQLWYAKIRRDLAPFDSITMLHRDTLATIHQPLGECVMEDSPRELRRHLPVLLAARGRVLISGLGLGCVVRGLLAKPEVEHIDVIEIDPSILDLAGREFMHNPRVTLHLGDAESIEWPSWTRCWDYAWHDVWSEDEALPIVHARLMARYRDMVINSQGAWQMPRDCKRALPAHYLGVSRRRRSIA